MRSKNYASIFAVKMQKQLNTVPADLYGGANDVVPGAGNLKFLDEESTITDATEKIVDSSINGTQADNCQETIAHLPTFDISTKVHTATDNDLLVGTLGFEALNGPKLISAGNYAHMILLQERGKDQRAYTATEEALVVSGFDADDRINSYFHLAQDLGPSTLHLKNCVAKSFEFSSAQKTELKMKITGTGETLTRDATHAGVSSWTSATGLDCSFKHYQGVLSVGVVGGADAPVQCLEFAAKGSFGLVEGVIPTGTANGGLAQAEPLSDGKTELTVDFRIYKHDTDVWKGYETGDTKLYAKMEYTKGNQFIGFYFPLLQVVSAQEELGEGGSVMVSCRGFLPTALDPFATERTIAASEWALPFTTRMYLIVKDQDASNYLRKV